MSRARPAGRGQVVRRDHPGQAVGDVEPRQTAARAAPPESQPDRVGTPVSRPRAGAAVAATAPWTRPRSLP